MAEAQQQHPEEHLDVLTRTGEKTGISKPRYLFVVSFSFLSPFPIFIFCSDD
jgi:hypothetical protein